MPRLPRTRTTNAKTTRAGVFNASSTTSLAWLLRVLLQVRNANFSAFIEGFTSTTYAMVIVSDPTIQPATTLINIEASRPHFESLIAQLL